MAARALCSTVGPGTGAALEATFPVSMSLEASSAPISPPPAGCTARDAPVGGGGGGSGNVRPVSPCLVPPFLLCPYKVLPVSCSLLVQLVPAVCLDYVHGVSR